LYTTVLSVSSLLLFYYLWGTFAFAAISFLQQGNFFEQKKPVAKQAFCILKILSSFNTVGS